MVVVVDFGTPVNDYCEVTSCQFGMGSNPTAGGVSRRSGVQGFNFTKGRDSLSDAIMHHCMAGTRFARVTIEVYQDEDSALYMTYKLGDVVIASLNSRGQVESVDLSYATVKPKYFSH
ncbi:MAG: type VI secretion system tube protein Hcp [Candidatus Solibacter sp.]|nr:type VI secretion system tube protein Hcp [Candidatus Solibacter sp.]